MLFWNELYWSCFVCSYIIKISTLSSFHIIIKKTHSGLWQKYWIKLLRDFQYFFSWMPSCHFWLIQECQIIVCWTRETFADWNCRVSLSVHFKYILQVWAFADWKNLEIKIVAKYFPLLWCFITLRLPQIFLPAS